MTYWIAFQTVIQTLHVQVFPEKLSVKLFIIES